MFAARKALFTAVLTRVYYENVQGKGKEICITENCLLPTHK